MGRSSRIFPAALLLCSAALSAQHSPETIPFRLLAQGLELGVDYQRGALSGTERLTLRNGGTTPAHSVPLLLNRLMTVSRVTGLGGAELPFTQRITVFRDDSLLQVNAIVVTLPRPVPPGDSLTLVLHYGGRLVGYTETGSLYIRDNVDSAFTIIRSDAYAFPVVGVPSREVNRATPNDPFAFSASITVPAGQVVATGGTGAEPVRHDSLVTWTYRSVLPTPALNIAIAPFRVLDRPGLRIFYFPEDSTGARMLEAGVTGALAKYAEWFGPMGGAAPLTVIEIPEGWGSQASLGGGIIQTADAFRDRGQLYQVYHELSHLWNVNDLDVPSPRWNEGLASLLQWRMAAELDGWAGWDARLTRLEGNLKRYCAAPTPCGTVPMAEYGRARLTDLSYSVGMAMFYALYRTMGAEAFDGAYRRFYQEHARAGGTTADLIAAFHRASPASDAIFADWMSTTRWYARLSAGESLRQIVEGYRQ